MLSPRRGALPLPILLILVVACPLLAAEKPSSDASGPPRSADSPIVVTIAAPKDGSTFKVGDIVDLVITSTEGYDVSWVAVQAGSRGIGMLDHPPFTMKWYTEDLDPGVYTIRAYPSVRRGGKMAPVSVTVILVGEPDTSSQAGDALTIVDLKQGTPVLLRTQERLVSGQIPEGAPVQFTVARQVRGHDGKVLIAYGASASGRVTKSKRHGASSAGNLEFTVDSATAVDCTAVPLRSSPQPGGEEKRAVVASALLPPVLASSRSLKEVDLPAGTEVMAYVDRNTVLPGSEMEPRGNAIHGEPMETAAITSPAREHVYDLGQSVVVTFSVTPTRKFARASLYIDGKESAIVAHRLAPLKLKSRALGPGNHTIEVAVQFLNGFVVRTTPVRISVKHG